MDKLSMGANRYNVEYSLAAGKACDAIGATTEALEAGVLQAMLYIVTAVAKHGKPEWQPAGWGKDQFIGEARACLAKLGAKEGT